MKLIPVIACLTLPAAALTGCGQATTHAAATPSASSTSVAFATPPPTASRSQVVTAFLHAVVGGQCAESRRLLVPPPAPQGGIPTYCAAGKPLIDGWKNLQNPGNSSSLDLAAELHLISDDTGGPVPRWATRFFSLTKTKDGWRISGGGTGP